MANEIYAVNGGKVTLRLHPGQTQAWDSRRRFVFIIAGTQSGKTSFGPWWLDREIRERGAGDYLAVTATYDLFKLKMLPEMRKVFELLGGWEWRAGDRVFASANSVSRPGEPTRPETRIILRSANSPEGLESATGIAAWLDECGQDTFRLESWEAVQRRLALSEGRVLGTTTPYNLGWLKTEVFDRWRAGSPDFQVVQFKSTMNPAFPRSEYDRAKQVLPDWKFRMFYDGEFIRPAGMIYGDFDDDIHVVDPFTIPPEWPRYVGIDFGAVHTAVLWIAEDPEKNVYYLYREYLEGNRTTQGHANAVKALSKGENVVRWTGGSRSEKQQRWDWGAAGIPVTESPIIDVEAGIDRVIELFKKERLFVFRTCRGVIDELGTYSRELDSNGQPTEKIKDKETFHRLDALRYAVSALASSVEIIKDPFAGW